MSAHPRRRQPPRGSLTTRQVARVLGLSEAAVRNRRDELGGHKAPGGMLIYPLKAVESAATEREADGFKVDRRPLAGTRTLRRAPAIAGSLRVVLYGLVVLSVLAVAVTILWGFIDAPGAGPSPNRLLPTPAPTHSTVTWTYVESTCADGWRSPSIGKRGACSHHGGVVSIYNGSDGSVLTCGTGSHAPDAEEQRRAYLNGDTLNCAPD